MAGRTFTELQKSMTLVNFNKFCKRLAEEYARTDVFHARSFFIEKFNVSESCYQKIKDYAVTHYLVSDYIVDCMEKKATGNQKRRAETSGISSYKHYRELRAQRRKFVFELAKEYAEHPEISREELIKKYGRYTEGYVHMLMAAFVGDYGVSFELAKKMQIRMLMDCNSESDCAKLSKSFEWLWQERNSRQEKGSP